MPALSRLLVCLCCAGPRAPPDIYLYASAEDGTLLAQAGGPLRPELAAGGARTARRTRRVDAAAFLAAARPPRRLPRELLDAVAPVRAGATATGCAICLDARKGGGRVRVLRCGHDFCSRCITRWFARESRCPLCNEDFAAAHADTADWERLLGALAAADATTEEAGPAADADALRRAQELAGPPPEAAVLGERESPRDAWAVGHRSRRRAREATSSAA